MNRLPAVSTTTEKGVFRRAWVAGPPSPEKPGWPVPATVVIVPACGACSSARLIREPEESGQPDNSENGQGETSIHGNLLCAMAGSFPALVLIHLEEYLYGKARPAQL